MAPGGCGPLVAGAGAVVPGGCGPLVAGGLGGLAESAPTPDGCVPPVCDPRRRWWPAGVCAPPAPGSPRLRTRRESRAEMRTRCRSGVHDAQRDAMRPMRDAHPLGSAGPSRSRQEAPRKRGEATPGTGVDAPSVRHHLSTPAWCNASARGGGCCCLRCGRWRARSKLQRLCEVRAARRAHLAPSSRKGRASAAPQLLQRRWLCRSSGPRARSRGFSNWRAGKSSWCTCSLPMCPSRCSSSTRVALSSSRVRFAIDRRMPSSMPSVQGALLCLRGCNQSSMQPQTLPPAAPGGGAPGLQPGTGPTQLIVGGPIGGPGPVPPQQQGFPGQGGGGLGGPLPPPLPGQPQGLVKRRLCAEVCLELLCAEAVRHFAGDARGGQQQQQQSQVELEAIGVRIGRQLVERCVHPRDPLAPRCTTST